LRTCPVPDLPVVRVDGPRGGSGRTYVRPLTGEVVPSVTTVISLTPKPYLLNWVVKLAAEWAADNIGHLADMGEWEEQVAAIKAATRELREEGATKGTSIHDYAEQYVWLGVVDPPVNAPQRAVIDIVETLNPLCRFTEAVVWNGTVGYAGTLDGVWDVMYEGREETWLIDWKTSKSRSAEWALQQEAYRRAETIIDGRGNEYPMPHIDRCVILYVPFDSPWEVFEVLSGDREWVSFQDHLRVLGWHNKVKVGDIYSDPLVSQVDCEAGSPLD
jgi:hypothetical protein